MEIPFRTIRTTFKLSTDMKEEEIREAIAKAMQIPLEQVPPIDFEAVKAKMRGEYEKVQKIIESSKALLDSDPKTRLDKYEELNDIGKFIIFFNENLQIHVPEVIQKFPDFTLLFNQFKIGVEHTRLWNNEARAMFKAAKHYLAKAEEIIAKDLRHLSKPVNIYIDYSKNVIRDGNFDNRMFSQEQKSLIPHLIADFIRSELTGGNVPKPAFVSQVEITPNKDSRVDLELAESYFTKTEFSDQLLECIAKKEEKADKYRNARTVNALWLLIVIDDVNSYSGFSLEATKIPRIEKSNFDLILIFEKFTGNIHILFYKSSSSP